MGADSWTSFFISRYLPAEVRGGNRPTTSFNKIGWLNILNTLTSQTGDEYSMKQIKNKWCDFRALWTLWIRLVNWTSVGWDMIKNAILANDEWWAERIAENKEAKKFRDGSSPHKELMKELFGGIIATGQDSYTPSSGILPTGRDDEVECVPKTEDNTFDWTYEPMVNDFGTPPSGQSVSRISGSSLRKEQPRKQKSGKGSNSDIIVKSIKQIAEDNGCRLMKDDLWPVEKCVKVLDNTKGIIGGDALWCKGMHLFAKTVERRIFLAIDTDEKCIAYLKSHMSTSQSSNYSRSMDVGSDASSPHKI